MGKKTFKVADLLQIVNTMNSTGMHTREQRQATNTLLEEILFKTDNYNGFHYLDHDAVPAGAQPGIIFDHSEKREHVYPDNSRVNYYK